MSKRSVVSVARDAQRRDSFFESLEPRLLLSSTVLAVGKWTTVDSANANPNDVDLVGLGSGTTAAVTATLNTTDNGGVGVADTINSVAVDTTAAAAGAISVDLVFTGPVSGPINFTTNANQQLTVRIIQDDYADAVGGTIDPQGQGDAAGINFTGANFVVNPDTDDAIADDDDLTADGALGAVNFNANTTIAGGKISVEEGNLGVVTNSGVVNLTSAFSIDLEGQSGAGVSMAGFNVVGATTLNAFGMDIVTAENAGGIGGPVVFGTVNINGAGTLTIRSESQGVAEGEILGAVTLGTVNVTSTGSLNVLSDGGNANINGAITTGPINITGTATGSVNIDPSGTGNFVGALSLGAITISGSATGAVNLGSADAAYPALTLHGLNATSTGAGSGLFVTGNGIAGLLDLTGGANYYVNNASAFTVTMGTADGGTGGFGSIDEANLIVGPAAAAGITLSFAGGGGAVAFGHLINYSTNDAADIAMDFDTDNSGDKIASWTSNVMYLGDPAGTDDAATPTNDADPNPLALAPAAVDTNGDIVIDVGGGVTGAVNMQRVVVRGDANDAGAGIRVDFKATNNNGGFGSLTVGDVALINNVLAGPPLNWVVFDTAGTGGINNVSMSNLTNDTWGGGADVIRVGHVGGATAATTLGNLTLGNVWLGASTGAPDDILFLARDIDNVAVTGTWTFNGLGDVVITADAGAGGTRDGALGTVGGTAWDLLFKTGTAGDVEISAADGSGAITMNRVDFENVANGGLQLNLNSDGDGVGAVAGDFTVRNQGTNAANEVVFSNGSNLTATDIADIRLAGGANGTITITNPLGSDTANVGVVFLGRTVGLTDIPNSDSTGLTLNVDDGIGSITVVGGNAPGLGSGLSAVTVNANADAATEATILGAGFLPVGSLGPVDVIGESNFATPEGISGTFTAADFDTFLLRNGRWSANITTNVAAVADRNALTSNVTSVTVQNGFVSQAVQLNNFTIDDGFVNGITVTAAVPVFGDASLGNIILDADGALAGGARGGGMPAGISATGMLAIAVLDSDAANEAVGATTFNALNNVGPLTAGQSIIIGTLDIGGNLGTPGALTPNGIILTDAPGTAIDADPTPDITITLMEVNGSLDRIAGSGAASENITINGASFIARDLDTIDAGLGNLTVTPGLRVLAAEGASPVTIFTDSNIDYILALDGTGSGGTATLDYTVVFPAAGDATIGINDIAGTTSAADATVGTRLLFETRAQGTAYTANDNSTAEWDVTTIQDTGAQQHDLWLVVMEGDLLGDIGADANPFGPVPPPANATYVGENILGYVQNLEIFGTWNISTSNIYVRGLGEIVYAGLDADHGPDAGNQFSYDMPGGVYGTGVLPPGGNINGSREDLEVYTAMVALTEPGKVIVLPDDGTCVTKMFVGPGGLIEYLEFSDKGVGDGVIDTVVVDFASGMIRDIHLFGENIGIEYNAADPANPATDVNTNIYYGYAQAGLTATEPSAAGQLAIEFIEFSSAIGDITVHDILTTNAIPVGVGNVLVGYAVALDNLSDVQTLASYINNPNTAGVGQTLRSTTGLTPAFVYAGMDVVDVDGPIGRLVSSGNVTSITTHDTVNETTLPTPLTPVGSAGFEGMVIDGKAGPIHIEGTVAGSLVVGDRVRLAGADGLAGTADDVTGINGVAGSQFFLGDIYVVGGNLGTTEGQVTGDLQPTIVGDQVSAPYGIDVNVTVALYGNLKAADLTAIGTGAAATQGQLRAAVVTGKHILVDTAAQDNDDLGVTAHQRAVTAVDIVGDVWSGDDINANLRATGATEFLAAGEVEPAPIDAARGYIGSQALNTTLNIKATGASAGDITGDITSDGNMTNVSIDAGTGTGGSVLGNVVAGTDGTGGITGTNYLNADQDLGSSTYVNVVSSADSMAWAEVFSGLQATSIAGDPKDGGDINADFLAGVPLGATVPIGWDGVAMVSVDATVNDANLPIFQVQNDCITITSMQAGWAQDSDADLDGRVKDDRDSDLDGTLVAAGSITVSYVGIDGDATGNDGVAGGHIAAAGMGYKEGTSNLNFGTEVCSAITGVLEGTFSAGMFVPFDYDGDNPLNPNDLGPLQVGTVLTLGNVTLGHTVVSPTASTLEVGAWAQSATGVVGGDGINLNELLDGTESGANQAFAPTFSVGATGDVTVNMRVVGLPNDGNTTIAKSGSVGPTDPATADATDVSIAAFNDVSGGVTVEDTADFNFVMSNIDAVTAIDTSEAKPGDPSDPSTGLALNSGAAADNDLDILSVGRAQGGLDVEFFLAGFDYFTRINTGGLAPAATNAPTGSVATAVKTPDFWASFGLGDIDADLVARDADPTNGLEVADLSFALIGAGEDIDGDYIAQDDIIARESSLVTDGTPGLIPDGFGGSLDGDFIAGLAANSSIAQFGEADLFPGGNIDARMVAGDDIYKRFVLVPGTPDQTVQDVQTYTTTAEVEVYGNAASTTLTFSKFDPAAVPNPLGGTVALTGVAMTAQSVVSAGTASVSRLDTSTVANGGVHVDQYSNLASALVVGPVTLDNTVDLPVSLAIGQATTGPLVVPADDTGVVPLNEAGLGNFVGPGTFTVDVTEFQSAALYGDFLAGGNSLTFTGGVFSGQVTLTYTYTITTTTIIPGTPDTYSGNPFLTIAAQGNDHGPNDVVVPGTGEIDIELVSGAEDQLAGPDLFNGYQGFVDLNGDGVADAEYEVDDDDGDGVPDDESGNIWAFLIAGDEVFGTIDAGDTQQDYGAVTNGGLGGQSGYAGGFFRGGIHNGAGVDLNIMTTMDNDVDDGDLDATIRTDGDLNVEDWEADADGDGQVDTRILLGIFAEGDIDGAIEVGWGCQGGDLLGNVVAEEDISEIEVWGNVGRPDHGSLIYAGCMVENFGVGDASGILDAKFDDLRQTPLYIDSFGTVYADLYFGGVHNGSLQQDEVTKDGQPLVLLMGDSLAETSTLIAGANSGFRELVLQQNGHTVYYEFGSGANRVLAGVGVFVQQGPNFGNTGDPAAPGYGPDIFAYAPEWNLEQFLADKLSEPEPPTWTNTHDIRLSVVSDSTAAGIGHLIAVDELYSLHVEDGSVEKITVSDDVDIKSEIDAAVATLDVPLTSFPFLTNSLPTVREIEHYVDDTKYPIGLTYVNVDYNIGTPGVNIGVCTGLLGIDGWKSHTIIGDNYAIYVQGDLKGVVESVNGSIGNVIVGGALSHSTQSIEVNESYTEYSWCTADDVGVWVPVDTDYDGVYDDVAVVGKGNGQPDQVTFLVDPNNPGLGTVTTREPMTAANVVNVTTAQYTQYASFYARQDIGDIYVVDDGIETGIDLGYYNRIVAKLGSLGVVSVQRSIVDPWIDVAENIGGLIARTGEMVLASGEIYVHGSVGLLQASHNISGTVKAETGDIGVDLCANDMFTVKNGAGIYSDLGDISLDLTAGRDIGNTEAHVMSVYPDYLAGRSIGNVTAGLVIGGSAGYSSTGGRTLRAERGSVGNLEAVLGQVDVAALAGLNIGNVTASELVTGSYTAEAGTIGNFLSEVGDVNVAAVGYAGIGNVTAGENVLGTYTSTNGAIGNVKSLVGSIGLADNRVVFKANGGVEVDQYTLEYQNVVNGTVLQGVGTVYAEIGDVYADIKTGGSVGAVQTPGSASRVLGGIAAPIGTVDVGLRVGGHVGGVSGRVVNMHDIGSTAKPVILGSIGLLRVAEPTGEDVSSSVFGIDVLNPLIITSKDENNNVVDYRVVVDTGKAAVDYTVKADGTVIFDSITYDASGSLAGISVKTTTGGRRSDGTFGDSSVLTTVEDLVVNGNVANIKVEGYLEALTVNGNLVGGTLDVNDLGSAFVSGNLGSARSTTNPFVATDMSVKVATGQWDKLDVGGTNYGSQTVTLASGQYLSWRNTLNADGTSGNGDEYITAYLGTGLAALKVNNGFLERVELANGTGTNLVVLADSVAYDGVSDALPTSKRVNLTTDKLLAGQVKLVDSGLASSGSGLSGITNRVLEYGSMTTKDVANVGTIIAQGDVKLNLKNVVVEGDLQKLVGSLIGSAVDNLTVVGDLGKLIVTKSAKNVDVRGDAGTVDGGLNLTGLEVDGDLTIAKAILTLSKVNVNGNAGSITAGTSVKDVHIDGSVEVINAGGTVSNVNVLGNAGVVSAGKTLTSVAVIGDVLALNGGKMTNVAVGGSVGLGLDSDGNVNLGGTFVKDSDFSLVARILGLREDATADDLMNLANHGDHGAYDSHFLGGVQADSVAGVSVGGAISDLILSKQNALKGGADGLLVNTMDDAFVAVGRRGNFVKEDGVLIEWPDRLLASERYIVVGP